MQNDQHQELVAADGHGEFNWSEGTEHHRKSRNNDTLKIEGTQHYTALIPEKLNKYWFCKNICMIITA